MFKSAINNDVARSAAFKWLALLQSPSLTSTQEEAFFSWLDESQLNQAAYLKAESLWERGEVLEKIEPASESEKPNSTKSWLSFNFPVMPAIAASIFVLFCGLGMFQYYQPTLDTGHYHTALGQQQEVTLSDGSVLLLNTDSDITVKYQKNHRIVQLNKGEVFFDIQKGEDRPFDVITNSGTIRVLGTQFSVFNTQDGTFVTVIEGRVGLSSENTPSALFEADITLTKNQQLSIEDGARGIQPKQVNASNKTAWRNNKLIYHGDRLEDVINDVNRYYDSQIVLGNPELAEKEVVAVLQLGNFSTTLTSLKVSLNLSSSVDDELEFITLNSKDFKNL